MLWPSLASWTAFVSRAYWMLASKPDIRAAAGIGRSRERDHVRGRGLPCPSPFLHGRERGTPPRTGSALPQLGASLSLSRRRAKGPGHVEGMGSISLFMAML